MRIRHVVPVLAVAGLVAACGGGSSGGSTAPVPPTQQPSTAAPVTPTVTASPSSTVTKTAAPTGSPVAGGGCATENLHLSLGTGGAAAGTFYFPIVFTNIGTSSCTLRGFPGVSYTTSDHTRIGRPATEDGAAGPNKLVTLAPGAKASARVAQPTAEDYPSSKCHAETSALLKVYPPGERTAAYLSEQAKVCSSSNGRSRVGPVQAGTHAANG